MLEWLLNVNHRKLSANYRKKLFLEIHGNSRSKKETTHPIHRCRLGSASRCRRTHHPAPQE